MASTEANPESVAGLSSETIQAWRERIRETTFSNYHYHMGTALEREGNNEAALAAYRRALEHQPDLAEAGHRLIGMIRQSGTVDEADRLHHRLLAINPFYVGDALAGQSIEIAEEDTDLAIRRLDGAIAAGVSRQDLLSGAHEAIGRVYYRKLRLNDSFFYFSCALEISPNSVDANFYLGKLQFERFNNAAAKKHLVECSSHAPNWPDPQYALAWCHLIGLEFDQALEALQRAEALGFRYPISVALVRGWTYHAQGRLDEAIAAYDALVKGYHQDTFLLISFKALALHAAGRLDEALSVHRAAARTNPSSTDVQLNMALALCDAGQIEGAWAAHRPAAAAEPARVWTVLTSAWIFARTGESESARSEYSRFVELSGNTASVNLRWLPDRGRQLEAMMAGA